MKQKYICVICTRCETKIYLRNLLYSCNHTELPVKLVYFSGKILDILTPRLFLQIVKIHEKVQINVFFLLLKEYLGMETTPTFVPTSWFSGVIFYKNVQIFPGNICFDLFKERMVTTPTHLGIREVKITHVIG